VAKDRPFKKRQKVRVVSYPGSKLSVGDVGRVVSGRSMIGMYTVDFGDKGRFKLKESEIAATK
jgi:hypothetical protein